MCESPFSSRMRLASLFKREDRKKGAGLWAPKSSKSTNRPQEKAVHHRCRRQHRWGAYVLKISSENVGDVSFSFFTVLFLVLLCFTFLSSLIVKVFIHYPACFWESERKVKMMRVSLTKPVKRVFYHTTNCKRSLVDAREREREGNREREGKIEREWVNFLFLSLFALLCIHHPVKTWRSLSLNFPRVDPDV